MPPYYSCILALHFGVAKEKKNRKGNIATHNAIRDSYLVVNNKFRADFIYLAAPTNKKRDVMANYLKARGS